MPGRVWTKDKLVVAIQELHAQDVDLSPSAVQRSHGALFASARSKSHFGSWRAAVEAAQIPYEDIKRVRQRWSRDEIVKQIREFHAQNEDLLDPRFKVRHRDLYLAACANRYFGSWKRALEAANLPHETMREEHVWTKTRILRTIQDLARQGKPLGWASIEEEMPGIYRAARRPENFGSWREALRAAGINPDMARGRRPMPPGASQFH